MKKYAPLATGIATGVGVCVYHGVLLFGMTEGLDTGDALLAYLPTAVAAMGTSVLATDLFYRLLQAPGVMERHAAFAPLVGAAGGLVAGALIGGVTYATFFGVMQLIDPEFTHHTDTLWENIGMGLLGGGAFGGMIGVLPGAALGLTIRLVY